MSGRDLSVEDNDSDELTRNIQFDGLSERDVEHCTNKYREALNNAKNGLTPYKEDELIKQCKEKDPFKKNENVSMFQMMLHYVGWDVMMNTYLDVSQSKEGSRRRKLLLEAILKLSNAKPIYCNSDDLSNYYRQMRKEAPSNNGHRRKQEKQKDIAVREHSIPKVARIVLYKNEELKRMNYHCLKSIVKQVCKELCDDDMNEISQWLNYNKCNGDVRDVSDSKIHFHAKLKYCLTRRVAVGCNRTFSHNQR